MIPEQLKSMFGIKDSKDLNMANNLWKMLDEMADSNPDTYKNFINKNIQEGLQTVKQKKDEKDKPYKIVPQIGFCLNMIGQLNEKVFDEPSVNQKIMINKGNWAQIKKSFPHKIKIFLNVCYSNRIKDPVSRSTKKSMTEHHIQDLKNIQIFYYSLQGPAEDTKTPAVLYFTMILNLNFYEDIMKQNGGRKILMGLAISYLQQRLQNDRNPLLKKFDPESYRKVAFYVIEKLSIEVNQKNYVFFDVTNPQQFLLEKEVDKQREIEQKDKAKKVSQAKEDKKVPQIKFKKQEVNEPSELKFHLQNKQPPKKVMIEVLKSEDNNQISLEIPYEMRITQKGYYIEFLLYNVQSMSQVNLEMKKDCIRLQTKGRKILEIKLQKTIDQNQVKAKFKKKLNKLILDTTFK